MQVTKYSNRKYYSHTDRKYVTLAALFKAFKENQEVTVIDHRTRLNITAMVRLKAYVQAVESGSLDPGSVIGF